MVGLSRDVQESFFLLPFTPQHPLLVGLEHLGWEGHLLDLPAPHTESTEGGDGMGQEIPQGARSDPESVLRFSPTLIREQMKESEERAWWSGCM